MNHAVRVSTGVLLGLILLGSNTAHAQTTQATAAPPPEVTAFFPKNAAVGVSPDTPLRITFNARPVLGSGKIQVFDAATNDVVESIDVTVRSKTKNIGGIGEFKYLPIIVTDAQAAVYLPDRLLKYGRTYYVTADAGVFQGSKSIDGPNAWRFTTRASAPAAGAARLTVAADGTGDFCTIQGAIDFIPEGNTTPVTLFIRNGIYNEIIAITKKNAITLVGEDRRKTIIAYSNSEGFNRIPGNPFGSTTTQPVEFDPSRGEPVYRRGLFLAHRVNDLTIANLTLHNTTAHGGGQSEAILINGTTDAHAILANVDLYSFQDTLQINGQAYLSNCHIEGDVDFMWGTGPVFFENCECKNLRNGAYYTQVRNPGTHHGFAYLRCTLDGAEDVTNALLSRIETKRFPNSEVAFIDCVMTKAVGPVAWSLPGTPANVHFWEYNSHDAKGEPIDVSKRIAASKQLKKPEDGEIIAHYSDPTWFLGGNWTPKIPAAITAQPAK